MTAPYSRSWIEVAQRWRYRIRRTNCSKDAGSKYRGGAMSTIAKLRPEGAAPPAARERSRAERAGGNPEPAREDRDGAEASRTERSCSSARGVTFSRRPARALRSTGTLWNSVRLSTALFVLRSAERAPSTRVDPSDRAQMHGLRGSRPQAPSPKQRATLLPCRHSAEFFILRN